MRTYVVVALTVMLAIVTAIIPSAPAPPLDQKCDNTLCTQVKLDDDVDGDNKLDATAADAALRGTPQTLFWGNQRVWTDGNDGISSGLDADLLDNLTSSKFLRSDVSGTLTGTLTVNGNLSLTGTMTAGSVPWERLTSFPSGCTSGQFVTAVGSTLTCGTPSGDITSVTAGTGLSGGGTSGDVTLSVNTTTIQARVTGTCTVGSAIRAVNANGTVVCDDSGPTWQQVANTTWPSTGTTAVTMPASCIKSPCRMMVVVHNSVEHPEAIGVTDSFQGAGNQWAAMPSGNGGTNGDGTSVEILRDPGNFCLLKDDVSGVETSPSQWSLEDISASKGCELLVFT